MRPDLATRFWAKVTKDGPVHPLHERCWEWTGSYRSAYGQIRNLRKNLKVNRVAYTLQVGHLPADLCVCHRCDNPRCVRGDHLFLGTNQENTADRQRKGRQARGAKCIPKEVARGDLHWSHRMPARTTKGERHGCAKLTEAKVAEILRRSAGGESGNALAKAFAVSRSAIGWILRGTTWRHVPRVSRGELVVEALAPSKAERAA